MVAWSILRDNIPVLELETCRLFAAELSHPAGEGLVEGGFYVEEFDAHANAGLCDAHDSQGFYGLAFAGEG